MNWDPEVNLKRHRGDVLKLVKIILFHEVEALVILMLLIWEGLKAHAYDHRAFVRHTDRRGRDVTTSDVAHNTLKLSL